MTGIPFIVVFILLIVAMVLAISKFKIHPFLAIMGIATLLGLVAGIPLVPGTGVPSIAQEIGTGFSGIFTGIGIVIIFGALIGAVLEITGGAFKLADVVVKVIGKRFPTLAIMIMGWIVSIPVFCDSGFVILNPVRKAIVKRTGTSAVATTIGLSTGLFASHVLVPLTPGPLAAADILGLEHNLILLFGVSSLVSIPALMGAYAYAIWIGKRVQSQEDLDIANDDTIQTYEELVKSYGKLPSGFMAFMPIGLPIILMALGSVASLTMTLGEPLHDLLVFLGTPIFALAAGFFFSLILLAQAGEMSQFTKMTDNTLKTVGPILFITAAGGVLGRMIQASDMVNFIQSNYSVFVPMGIFLPFIISAILKSAQGSSTVAIIATANIMVPIMAAMGFGSEMGIALVILAIGAGAMVVSHANDSYFWVVTNLGNMTPQQGYKTQTVATLIQGLCCMIGIFVLSLIFV